jgi:hypothetical protein
MHCLIIPMCHGPQYDYIFYVQLQCKTVCNMPYCSMQVQKVKAIVCSEYAVCFWFLSPLDFFCSNS